MYDFISFGEILIDMISQDYVDGLEKTTTFEKHFGGSPANIAMNLSEQGFKSAVVSKVGDDPFGKYIISRLKFSKVEDKFIFIDKICNTDIVFVLKSKISPEFFPYRSSSLNLEINEKVIDSVKKCKIFHFSSWAISTDNNLEKTIALLKCASENNVLVGFDPNYREVLWHSSINIKDALKLILPHVNIIKPSDDDAKFIFGKNPLEKYITFFHDYGVNNVILTLGSEGSIISDGRDRMTLKSYAEEVVDTTGAGDAFWSGVYIGKIIGFDIFKAVKLGNAFSAENLKKVGAVIRLDDYKKLIKKFIE
jgi:fructokinase